MNLSSHVYLSVGGYIIHIQLGKTDREDKISHFRSLIKSHFSAFVIPLKKSVADYTIRVKDIKGLPYHYRNKTAHSSFFIRESTISCITYFFISHYQFAELLKIIVIHLLGASGFLLHASAISTPYGVVAFAGKEGSGKSTTLAMTSEIFSSIADDCLIIRKINNRYLAYTSPHIEKNSANVHKTINGAPLAMVLFVHKNSQFRITQPPTAHLTSYLLSNVWIDDRITTQQVRAISNFINRNKNKCFFLYRQKKDTQKVISFLTKALQS